MAKSREKYHQIVCRIAGGAGTIIEAVSEAGGRRSQIILVADARKADKAIELVETVLEAGAGRADEAVDLVIEVILVAVAEKLIKLLN